MKEDEITIYIDVADDIQHEFSKSGKDFLSLLREELAEKNIYFKETMCYLETEGDIHTTKGLTPEIILASSPILISVLFAANSIFTKWLNRPRLTNRILEITTSKKGKDGKVSCKVINEYFVPEYTENLELKAKEIIVKMGYEQKDNNSQNKLNK